MIYRPESANITIKKIERTFTYKNTEVLILDIEYPEVSLPGNSQAEYRINSVIMSQVKGYQLEAAGPMYREAVENYINAQKEGYPFNMHGLTVRYIVTLNQDCALSQYRDKYIYSGGAHGITPRASDTFDLCTGRRVSLDSLFPHDEDWKSKVLGEVLRQADEILIQDPNLYFDNYRELILKYFNPDSFYLTETGVVVYYQQYDIGPYAIGIPVFEIPYANLGIDPPKCTC